jgi:glycosyltransferase involved in cell wall biosynthesis
LKILHLIYTHGISGAEKYLKHLLPGLKAYGIDCDLIVVCPKNAEAVLNPYCAELNSLGIKTTLILGTRLTVFATAKKINSYLKASKISIVHSHLLNSDFIAAVIKTFFFRNLYLISTKHGYQEKVLQQYAPGNQWHPNDLYYFITKFTLSRIDKNIAVSKGIAELYHDIKLSKEVYPFIHHGVKVEDFNKEDYRSECRLADPQLIIVGRIELFKGHHFLIDALSLVTGEFPGVKLLILGEGSEKNNCVERINRLGLQKNVEFLGFKAHPYSYISLSDVIILPSLFEPFGLVYIEAFALKTPVVAFNTRAGNEIMENNETALMVEKGDSGGLAQKIVYMLKNAGERSRIAEQAYTKYKNSFTTEVMVRNTANWYLSLNKK